MAPATTKIVRRVPTLDDQWNDIKAELVHDPDTMRELLRLVRAAQDSGILPFITGLLEQKNSVLSILMEEFNQAGVKKAINNGEQLAALLGTIPQSAFQAAVSALGQGLDKMGQASGHSSGGMNIFQLLGAFRNPDVAQGLRALLSFLEGFGQAFSPPGK